MENDKDALPIAEILQNKNLLTATTQNEKPLADGAKKLLQAVQNKKIFEESDANLNNLFRYCFILVGLREKNFPGELETEVIYAFLKENYGGHTIAEIKLAFEMAIKGKLDLGLDDVKCYENFSVIYLSSIINSFRRWASKEYIEIERHIPPPTDQKRLEAPEVKVHWGAYIEKAYQHFLSFEGENWKIFPLEFYDQLVADKILEPDVFRSVMVTVRKNLIGELQRDKVLCEMRRFEDADKNENTARAKSMNQTKMNNLLKKIEDYNSGELDEEISRVAKRFCVLEFFRKAKAKFQANVYVPAD